MKVLDLAKQIHKYCVGMEGNVSTKIGDVLWIKASGARLSNLSENDLVSFDFKGNQLSNLSKSGSMELSFHTFLLQFDGINYVSHTHPTNTLKIICGTWSDIFARRRLFPDQVIFNGKKSCLIPYTKPGEELTEMIKVHVNEFINSEGYFPKVILLQNHGIICCGSTIDECVMSTDICEKSAEIFIGAKDLIFLKDDDVDSLVSDKKEKYRESLLR